MAVEMAPGWNQWNPARFEILRKLEDAPRNNGHVLLMRDSFTGLLVAVKQVPTWWMLESHSEFASKYPEETELPWMDVAYMAFLNKVEYQWACELLGIYRDEESTYIVSSFASEGDLFSWSMRVDTEPGPEREAVVKPLAVQLLKAVQQLHELSIVHRDLSCENVLVTKAELGDDMEIRLIDFAAASSARISDRVHGKEAYVAPEVHVFEAYDGFLSDAFACGIIILSALVQRFPWNSTRPGRCKSFEYVKKHGLRKYFQRRKLTDVLSDSCMRFLEGLLIFDPAKRLSLGEEAFGDRPSVWQEEWVASVSLPWSRQVTSF
eukprot:gb/GFBE01065437.1/.p1 GENE.gb/GFBE01065437.1/~~gb/GFBE01065437.1/.p1  ORF type:complete len:321 (+),score=39.21 gb/GFBE01065437.1/:1-963(+)